MRLLKVLFVEMTLSHWHYCIGWIQKSMIPSQRDTRTHEMAQKKILFVLAIISLSGSTVLFGCGSCWYHHITIRPPVRLIHFRLFPNNLRLGDIQVGTIKLPAINLLQLLPLINRTTPNSAVQPAEHVDGHEHSCRKRSASAQVQLKRGRDKTKHTQRQIRHIKLPQLHLLRVRELGPAHVIRNASRRRHRHLHSINQQMYRNAGVI
jgi:hypothetical protein